MNSYNTKVNQNDHCLLGRLVDIYAERIYPAKVTIQKGKIVAIEELQEADVPHDYFLMPGFIDSHVHIESSLLIPSEFARLAVQHGTVATISDPHEIANVCGMKGIEFMINNGKQVPFKFHFGAPSCVPATNFETTGAIISVNDVEKLLTNSEINYLSEMMNFPGVLSKDKEVIEKIALAKLAGKPVDGHAPGLRGDDAQRYIDAGISTDHECVTYEEAKDKLDRGMKILIREGSAAKNFEALIELLRKYPHQIMFCSDDKHPDSLIEGHINHLCARAIAKGIPLFHVLRAACINPAKHYSMRVGLLRIDDPADLVVVRDLQQFKVLKTYIDGQVVFDQGRVNIKSVKITAINQFQANPLTPIDIEVTINHPCMKHPIIEALDGQLITKSIFEKPILLNEKWISNDKQDILKIVVINRYHSAPPAVAFIKNFNLKKGAIASSVAHDSHNIVALGCDDRSICEAVNLVIKNNGGLCAVENLEQHLLPLPVAGLMSSEDGFKIASQYTKLDRFVKDKLGSTLKAPFMTLSFMSLLVIPHIKLSDKGLFDSDQFSFFK